MSLRPSSAASPRACSGLMYSGVPIDMPVSVSRFAPPARSTSRAMPKSLTTAWWKVTASPSAKRPSRMTTWKWKCGFSAEPKRCRKETAPSKAGGPAGIALKLFLQAFGP